MVGDAISQYLQNSYIQRSPTCTEGSLTEIKQQTTWSIYVVLE